MDSTDTIPNEDFINPNENIIEQIVNIFEQIMDVDNPDEGIINQNQNQNENDTEQILNINIPIIDPVINTVIDPIIDSIIDSNIINNEDLDENAVENADENADVNADVNADENVDENDNINYINIDDNIINVIPQLFGIPTNNLLNEISNEHDEIMSLAYDDVSNIDGDIINFINGCYLRNLQYDDEPIDTIRYTIRTALSERGEFEFKKIISNIFSYGMSGMNYVFNENYEILNELLSSELKRILRIEFTFRSLSQMMLNGGIGAGAGVGGAAAMEDVKLILTKEELDKIPVNIYKEIKTEIKEKNECCPVCRDNFDDNDNVRTLNCGHIFHTDCVDNWLTNHSHKCPCCRQTTGVYKPNL